MNPGRPLSSLKQISAKLGVSCTTISRVLSGQAGKYRISDRTAARVRELVKKENYTPNPIARSLRLRKTHTIGLVIPDIANPFFAGIARQVVSQTRPRGYSIILCDSEENADLERQAVALLWNRRVDGMIVCPVGRSPEDFSGTARDNRPVVLVDRVFPGATLPSVTSDNLAGGRMAAEYLLENGHRRIACLRGIRESAPGKARVAGYLAALEKNGVRPDDTLIAGDSYGERAGYLDTKHLLLESPGFTALFATSNLLALGALRALSEAGLRVPDDVSLVAYDDLPYLRQLSPPLTTVAQPVADMGVAAVRLLLGRLEPCPDAPKTPIILPPTLVIRESVRKIT
ncbi:MAG: LacI family transcriptional regulator [Opitutaceae bacterium]|jgi:LacI family transcriptional regulator|nr:LacI family transcriptional regulator [Opitutaceae bacterium]